MLLWNAVDGFTEIDDPFLIKDNEIVYGSSSQSKNILPGKDGFIPLQKCILVIEFYIIS